MYHSTTKCRSLYHQVLLLNKGPDCKLYVWLHINYSKCLFLLDQTYGDQFVEIGPIWSKTQSKSPETELGRAPKIWTALLRSVSEGVATAFRKRLHFHSSSPSVAFVKHFIPFFFLLYTQFTISSNVGPWVCGPIFLRIDIVWSCVQYSEPVIMYNVESAILLESLHVERVEIRHFISKSKWLRMSEFKRPEKIFSFISRQMSSFQISPVPPGLTCDCWHFNFYETIMAQSTPLESHGLQLYNDNHYWHRSQCAFWVMLSNVPS